MTTPTGPRESAVILSAETSKYVTAMKAAASQTEESAGKIVIAVNGITSAWVTAEAAAKSAAKAMGSPIVIKTPTAGAAGATQSTASRRSAEAAERTAFNDFKRNNDARVQAQRNLDKARADSNARDAEMRAKVAKIDGDAQARLDRVREQSLSRQEIAQQRQISLTRAQDREAQARARLAPAVARVDAAKVAVESTGSQAVRLAGFAPQAQAEATVKAAAAVRELEAAEKALADAIATHGRRAEQTTTAQERLNAAVRTAAVEAEAAAGKSASAQSQIGAAAERAAAAQRAATARQITAFHDMAGITTRIGLGLSIGFGASAAAALKWQDQFTRVARIAGVTGKAADDLESSLRNISRTTPASHGEVADIAEQAAQLGIGSNNLAKFTNTIVELAAVTDISTTQAASALARLINITGDSTGSIDRIGSALVELSNHGASTVPQLVEIAARFAGVARIVHLTTPELLGISSALGSTAKQAEASGSAVQSVFLKMYTASKTGGQALEAFGRVALKPGQNIADAGRLFAESFGKDPGQAFLAWEQGLDRISTANGNVTASLKDAGITEIRQVKAVLNLAASHKQLARDMKIANDAAIANVALQKAFNTQNASKANQLREDRNRIVDDAITIGTTLLPALAKVAGAFAELADGLAKLPGPLRDAITYGGAFAGVWLLLIGRTYAMRAATQQLTRATLELAAANRAVAGTAGAAATAETGVALGGAAGGAAKGGSKTSGLLGMFGMGALGSGKVASLAKGGLAVLGVQVAADYLDKHFLKATIDADALSASVANLATQGAVTKESLKSLGVDLDFLFKKPALGDKINNKILHLAGPLGSFADDLDKQVGLGGDTIRRQDEQWKALDKTLTDLQAKSPEMAAATFGAIAAQANAAGMSTDELLGHLKDFSAAYKDTGAAAKQSAEDQAQAQAELQQQLSDIKAGFTTAADANDKYNLSLLDMADKAKEAKVDIESLRTAVEDSVSKQQSAGKAADDYQSSLNDLRKAIKGTADESTAAADAVDVFKTAIDNALGAAFDPQDALDKFRAKVDDIKTRLASNAGNGIVTNMSPVGDTAGARENRADIEDLIRSEADLYRQDVAGGANAKTALAGRRKQLEDALSEVGYYQADIAKALTTFDSLPKSLAEAAKQQAGASSTDKTRSTATAGKSDDAIANRNAIRELVSQTAAQIEQDKRFGGSQKAVNQAIADHRAELVKDLRALGFSQAQIAPYIDDLNGMAAAYDTARTAAEKWTPTTDPFTRTGIENRQAIRELAGEASDRIQAFATDKKNPRTQEQVRKYAAQVAADFKAQLKKYGFSASQIESSVSFLEDFGSSATAGALPDATVKVKADTAPARKSVQQLEKDLANTPVAVPFRGQAGSKAGKVTGWLQWAYDGIWDLQKWLWTQPIQIVFKAVGAITDLGKSLYNNTIGRIPGLADGGIVKGPGGSREDKIPAMLSNGEAVIPAAKVAANRGLVDHLLGSKNPYTSRMHTAPFDQSQLARASAPAAAPVINLSGGGDIDYARLASLIGSRPVVIQLDGREVARVLGGEANLRSRAR